MVLPLPIDPPQPEATLHRAEPPTAALGVLLERLPRRLFLGQLSVMALLGTLHALLTWAPRGTYHTLLVRSFDVDHEMNLPTWFASTQWLLLGLILAGIAIASRFNGESRLRVAIWSAAALGACYFSADEVAVLHERIGTLLEEILQKMPRDAPLRALLGFRSYYWVLFYGPIFLPVAVGLGVFLWKNLGQARRMALLGIFVFFYAAVGLDLIEGRYGNSDHTNLPISIFSRTIAFDIFLVEELLEMLGVALVSAAFLRHLSALVSSSRADGLPVGPSGD